MGSVVAVEYVSLDGVMQSPGRPDEDTRGGFDRGGWASELLADDPVAAEAAMAGQGRTVAMLFGRRTYLDLVGHWLTTTEPNPFTQILRDIPKYVVSSTLTEPLPYPASELLSGDPAVTVRRVREAVDGDVVVLGSGQLVRALAAADLVDRYVLAILPVLLGSGARLFDGAQARLTVEQSVTSPRGTVVATYVVDRR
ncbi:MAG: dihydrofolate reductase family protein [Kineosporiaceae bacterium]